MRVSELIDFLRQQPGDSEVELAIAIQVTDRQRPWRVADSPFVVGAKAARTVAEQNRNGVRCRTGIGDSQIQLSVGV